MRAGAGLVTALAAGALLLSACGPTVGGAGAIDTPTTAAATTSSRRRGTPPPTPTEPAAPPPTATPVPTATQAPAYAMTGGSRGDQVRELQARLKQLDWYDGKAPAPTTTRPPPASAASRASAVCRRPGRSTTPPGPRSPAMTRQPTKDELTNTVNGRPGAAQAGVDRRQGPRPAGAAEADRLVERRCCDAYGPSTTSAVQGVPGQAQIPVTGEVDQRTMDKLSAMTRKPTNDELNNVKPTAAPVPAAGLDPRCMTGRVMCISKSSRTLTWVIDGSASDEAGRCGSGPEYTPTREGVFSVFQKEPATGPRPSTARRCPTRCSSAAARPCTTRRTSRPAGTSGASHGCVNVKDLGGDRVAVRAGQPRRQGRRLLSSRDRRLGGHAAEPGVPLPAGYGDRRRRRGMPMTGMPT